IPGDRLLEMEEPAEWPFPDHTLMHRHADAVHGRRVDTELRLAVAACRPLEELRRRGHAAPEGRVGQRVQWVLEIDPGRVGSGPKRAEGGVIEFVELVIRQAQPLS